MSSTSSSSSRSQRAPLHERSSSETNKLGIRLVPYSPPRPAEQGGPSGQATVENEEPHGTAGEPVDRTPSKSTAKFAWERGPYANHPGSALSSPASSASSLGRPRLRTVSGARLNPSLSGAEPTSPPLAPVTKRGSFGSNTSRINASYAARRLEEPSSPTSSIPSRSRRSNVIEVNPDKTFSVILKPARQSDATTTGSSFTSAPVTTSSLVSSSHEQVSFDVVHDYQPSSPLSSVHEPSVSPSTPRSTASKGAIEESDFASPWNYRMVGGLRKVPRTPDFKQKGKQVEGASPADLSPSQEAETSVVANPELAAKPSFSSDTTSSSLDDTTNLKVLDRSSSPIPDSDSAHGFPSSSEPNIQILGVSSPIHPGTPAYGSSILETPGSRNFVVHNVRTPASYLAATPSRGKALLETPGSQNFVVHGENTPSSQLFTPSHGKTVLETPGSKNFVTHGDATPSSELYTPYTESAALDTPGSQNFVVHGELSRQTSAATFPRQPRHQLSNDSIAEHLREKYSQESLVVPPLNPRKRSSQERFNYLQRISRESLRGRTSSFSSISSVISQDAASLLLASQALNPLSLNPTNSSANRASWAGPSGVLPYRTRMEAHPHQWSSQLSTVMSEDERSEGSRVVSQFSERSASQSSRHVLSISSMSLSAEDARSQGTQSRLELERPSPTYAPGQRELPTPPIRMIRDHDEDGDGLADLDQSGQLRHKPSWTRVGGYLTRRGSDRELHSSASSRAGSISTGNIPYWARVYYGSGERRWLAAPSLRTQPSIQSLAESRPGSSWGNASPIEESFPADIFNPRRRVRDGRPQGNRPDSMEITPAGPMIPGMYRIKKKTSSVWSPHLRVDRRSTLYSAWQPPSVAWSAESGMLGRRNVQVVLFVFGFCFPFAWMIAALLPLPVPSGLRVGDPDTSRTELGDSANEKGPQDPLYAHDPHYQSARWWRNLNRIMSLIGILVLGAVAALAVIGIKDGWGQS